LFISSGSAPALGRKQKSDEAILNEKGIQPFKTKQKPRKNDVNSKFLHFLSKKPVFENFVQFQLIK